ncbi:MAG TPA: diacylglycerol kinase family protein [Bacteroidia bacterium]|nr:diacylglycerol kinase family protein [Bacteroidia bacterium]
MKNNVLIKILHSFVYAFNGIVYLLKNETNGRVHFFATAVVIAAGIYYRLNAMEWVAISLCIGMVLAAELLNTAIEKIVDFISPNYHHKAGTIKDLAAAGVMVLAIVSIVVAAIIFWPKIVA